MKERIERFLCWLTGYHIYDRTLVVEFMPRCRFCGRHLEERCTGWPEVKDGSK